MVFCSALHCKSTCLQSSLKMTILYWWGLGSKGEREKEWTLKRSVPTQSKAVEGRGRGFNKSMDFKAKWPGMHKESSKILGKVLDFTADQWGATLFYWHINGKRVITMRLKDLLKNTQVMIKRPFSVPPYNQHSLISFLLGCFSFTFCI